MFSLAILNDDSRRQRGRGGLRSGVPAIAWAIRKLDLGPTTRPIAPWTRWLVTLVLAAAALNFLDGVLTVIALNDPSHPFVAEAWGPSRALLETTGAVGFLLGKAVLALGFVGLMEFALRRGLPGSARLLSLLGTAFCGLVVLNSILILTSPPTF